LPAVGPMSLSPYLCVSVCVCLCLSLCRFSYLAPKYFVQDAQSQTVFVTEGPACIIQGLCFTQDQEFIVSLSLSLPLSLCLSVRLSVRGVLWLSWVGVCG